MERKNENQKKYIVIAAALLLVFGITVSYAWLRISVGPAQRINKIKAGTIELRLDETTTDGINLIKEVPKSYTQGYTDEHKYTFTLVNTGTTSSNYTITLNDLANYDNGTTLTPITAANRLNDNLIRVMVLKNGEAAAPEKSRLLSLDPGRVLDTGVIPANITRDSMIEYSVYVWIDSEAGDNGREANVMNKLFSGYLTVDAIQTHN